MKLQFFFCAPAHCAPDKVAAKLIPSFVIQDHFLANHYEWTGVINNKWVIWKMDLDLLWHGQEVQPWTSWLDTVRVGVIDGRPPASDVEAAKLMRSLLVCGSCDLKRFGSSNDGGYLMCTPLGDVDAVYSYGINREDDWGFAVSHETSTMVHQYDCENHTAPPCLHGKCDFKVACMGAANSGCQHGIKALPRLAP